MDLGNGHGGLVVHRLFCCGREIVTKVGILLAC